MNRNHISRRELIIRMGMEYHAEIANRVSGWLKGKSNPSKLMIDRMLKATGMTYEELFAREEEHE
jgi:transcriptional regulator with XRE-family HTH domain